MNYKDPALYKLNQPRLPMPNLHNVGEGIYGGVQQTPVNITVGTTSDPNGAHTVYHPKYKDVLKSLVKEQKGGDLYHDAPPHCLNTFDKNGKEISKRQKSLPPNKHNNRLFAEQLTLKLNIAASDSGIFPLGLGDLIYDFHQTVPTAFDGKSIREIAAQVDSFLSCDQFPKGVIDSTIYLDILWRLNSAFTGPIDTVSWSCGKVKFTGVMPLGDVQYLHANPSAVPRVDFSRGPVAPYTQQPSMFMLSQNYPNPFNPTTTIEFELPEDAVVTVKVYNTLGQEVATLAERAGFGEGINELEFSAENLPSGVYYYRIVAEDVEGKGVLYSSVKKMLLIK